jgi:ATP-dependent Clp protease ATP-binding subunit ClpC
MATFQEDLDPALRRAYAESKRLSVECRQDKLRPEAIVLAGLTTGPNHLTDILYGFRADPLVLAKKVRQLLARQAQSDEPYRLDEIRLPAGESCRQMLRLAEECRRDIGGGVLGLLHVVFAALRLRADLRLMFESEGVIWADFSDAVRNACVRRSQWKRPPASGPRSTPRTDEEEMASVSHGGQPASDPRRPGNVLDRFCVNLTDLAAQQKLDPVIGRKAEIEQIWTILRRKKKNNPLLVGLHGVGKTAVVEALAQQIADGSAPPGMRDKKVFCLDLASLVAGTQYRGQFEERLKDVLQAVRKNIHAIVFIDEIHTLLGAGGAIGALDAANILKPALARGELRCIGATTDAEYRRFFRKDGALDRRFRRVEVDEPGAEQTLQIVRGLCASLERHHHCVLQPESMEAAVRWSDKFIEDRHFPDKAIDVIDEACARFGAQSTEDNPTIIAPAHVAQVVADQAGVSCEIVSPSDLEKAAMLEMQLRQAVVGQEAAVKAIAGALRRAYAGVRDLDRPIGTFVLGGPSNTGKTHTAEQLARILFGSAEALITVNLAEFSESFQMSRLIGSPPGYVGHGERNQLTDRIMRRPHSVVLFDEIGRAHPDVAGLLLQILLKGKLTDAEGTEADFRSALILMTLGTGTGGMSGKSIGFRSSGGPVSAYEEERGRLVEVCKGRFGVEFVNRVDEFVAFLALTDEDLAEVARLGLQRIAKRMESNGVRLHYSVAVPAQMVAMGRNATGENAARIHHVLRTQVEALLAEALTASPRAKSVALSVAGDSLRVRCGDKP